LTNFGVKGDPAPVILFQLPGTRDGLSSLSAEEPERRLFLEYEPSYGYGL